MKVYMKIFIFWEIIFSTMLSAQSEKHMEEEKFFVNRTAISKKYGTADASGHWVLNPDHIEKIFDYELNLKDSITVFHQSKVYKNSNIFLGNKYGLKSSQGKILVPAMYDYLICQKGTCAASVDNKTYIIDYQNNKKTEAFEGYVKYYVDSLIILEQKQNHHYVKNLRSGKLDGPFYYAKILEGKNIYYTSTGNKSSFHRLNGESILSSDDIYYMYGDNFFADDVYIAYQHPRIFFKNLQGKIFANFDNIETGNGEFFEICQRTQRSGDNHSCNRKIKYTIFDILNGLGEIYRVNGNYYNININYPESSYDPENVPPVNIIQKNKEYAFANTKGNIISPSYSLLTPSFANNEDTFYFEKKEDGKTISGIIENGAEILKTDARVIDFHGNQMLVFDKSQNHYKIISKDGEIILKDVPVPLKFVGTPFESKTYTFTASHLFFTADNQGKIKQTQFQQLSNFYKGYAFASQKPGEILIINEKLKVVKKLPNLKFIDDRREIDSNGNLVFQNPENSAHEFLINYKGEVILGNNNTRINRINDYLYRLNNTFVDKDGKPFYDYGENQQNTKIFRRKNYFYIMVNLRDRAPDFYFFDNFGNFLGKDLPLYKQPIK